MRFNKRVAANDDTSDNINESNLPRIISQSTSLSTDNSKVISIDTISLDRHSRLTLTKRVKDVFPIEPGDRIAVYQNTGKISNELIFEVQRRNSIVDVWIMKRNTIGVSTKTVAAATTTTAIPHNDTIKSKSQKDGYYYNHHDDHLDQNNKNDNSSSPNIMLIDDEPDLLVAFESILSAEGYNIEAFSNSKEALKRFLEVNMNNNNNNKNREPSTSTTTTTTTTTTTNASSSSYYNLVITDIRMPGLNGIQLYQILKALSADVKILFISALDAAQEVVSALPAVRPSDIIQKPVEAEHFIKKINEAIIS
jgi:CheY-like chemotaxis protein